MIIKRLNDCGYTTIRLFGNLYLVRVYSKNYMKFCPFWQIRWIKNRPYIDITADVVQPKGKFRTGE